MHIDPHRGVTVDTICIHDKSSAIKTTPSQEHLVDIYVHRGGAFQNENSNADLDRTPPTLDFEKSDGIRCLGCQI